MTLVSMSFHINSFYQVWKRSFRGPNIQNTSSFWKLTRVYLLYCITLLHVPTFKVTTVKVPLQVKAVMHGMSDSCIGVSAEKSLGKTFLLTMSFSIFCITTANTHKMSQKRAPSLVQAITQLVGNQLVGNQTPWPQVTVSSNTIMKLVQSMGRTWHQLIQTDLIAGDSAVQGSANQRDLNPVRPRIHPREITDRLLPNSGWLTWRPCSCLCTENLATVPHI